ncbi:MAG: peptide chain release factor N(5)-glutamine methyltransferase [Acidobacteriota bacterium]
MTLKTALLQGIKLLTDAGVQAPRLTAEVLLAHAAQSDRQWLIAHSNDELVELWWIHYGRYLHQRIEGKPTQQIVGKVEFYGRDFRVTPDVLIPRPETEHLIEAALDHARGRVIDVGTGSGCIAGTLAAEVPTAQVFATDISKAALAVARGNALGVTFVEGDLLAGFKDESFDLVVSNPPYVALRDRDMLQREVREHEPALALFGGEDGLDVYRRLIPEAARVLKPEGWLVLEIGAEQGDSVRAMLAAANGGILTTWSQVEIKQDLAGLDRVAIARRA